MRDEDKSGLYGVMQFQAAHSTKTATQDYAQTSFEVCTRFHSLGTNEIDAFLFATKKWHELIGVNSLISRSCSVKGKKR